MSVSHSFEQFYQAVRRCWRFGQTRPVDVHVIASEAEGAVVANLRRKEQAAREMAEEMSGGMLAETRRNVRGLGRTQDDYEAGVEMTIPAWLKSEEAA